MHLIFWEKRVAGVKMRQEILLEALQPFRFWSVPSNSHRVRLLNCLLERLDRARLPQSALAQLPFFGPCERNRAASWGRGKENELIKGCGPGWRPATTLPVSRLQGGFSSWFAYKAREAESQGDYFLCLGKARSIWPAPNLYPFT
jgi:hypothetical protein